MNEEANFCSQCGVTVTSGAKFCSSCGHDLTNSSTKITPDKTVKVEVTNVTVEKGVKAVKAMPKRVWRFLKPLLIVLVVIGFLIFIVNLIMESLYYR